MLTTQVLVIFGVLQYVVNGQVMRSMQAPGPLDAIQGTDMIMPPAGCLEKCAGVMRRCYIAHPTDCMRYINCRRIQFGFEEEERVCPHGLFWAGGDLVLTEGDRKCNLPSFVQCPNDICLLLENDGTTFPHVDNCKQYWQCESGTSVPKCCPGLEKYNIITHQCEYDRNQTCSLRKCDGPFMPVEDIPSCERKDLVTDGHCGSFWDCELGRPIPICCPVGEKFNATTRICEEDPFNPCTIPCPRGYEQLISPLEQSWLDGNCSENCYQNFCQFAYGDDCRMYLTCEWTRNGFHGTKKVCPHGMFWSRDQPFQRDQANRTASCSLASDVQCPHDPCAIPTNDGASYPHFGNCKQYWHCEGQTSIPRCCLGFERYNPDIGQCEYNVSKPCDPEECDSTLVPDICVQNEPVNDHNCGTYWTCDGGLPMPTCCVEGLRFDETLRRCVEDSLNPCMDKCPEGYKPTLTQEQIWLNGNCSLKCIDVFCQFADDFDCRKYITCDMTATGYVGRERVCPHGEFFAREFANGTISCVVAADVNCPNDPCYLPENSGGSYRHFDSCKQYWQCETNVSSPKCCPGFEHYNAELGECVYNRSLSCLPRECDSALVPDICLRNDSINDNLCGTYWECKAGTPMPTCCPEGLRYNSTLGDCEYDPSNPCLDTCPFGYVQPPISDEQRWLNSNCSAKCYTDYCQFAYGEDCMTYLTCEWRRIGFHGTKLVCPHGTFFARGLANKTVSCVEPSEVDCPFDPCLEPGNIGSTYPHFESCKKYWQCDGMLSVPKCCPGLERYNEVTEQCEFNRNATCLPEECDSTSVPDFCLRNELINDNNCGTYWACETGLPYPACCPARQRFNATSNACEEMPFRPCLQACPEGYKLDPKEQEQLWLNANCTEQCFNNFCQFAFGEDCVTYLTCEWTRKGFHGTKKVCPHGTFWGGDLANLTSSCFPPSDAQCPTDPCSQPANVRYTFPYFDSCKKYWLCEGNTSVPKCCPGLERYNVISGECEFDRNATCQPEECYNTSVADICLRNEPVHDNHCGTYWACEGGVPEPTCCPEGQHFNSVSYSCEEDLSNPCVETCPEGYKPGISQEQIWLNSNCSEKCYAMFCQFDYGNDCSTYLTCRWTRNGFHGTKKVCPHGSFFAGDQANRNISCVLPVDAQCPYDPCILPDSLGMTYSYFDSCKKYWQCEGSTSVPKCCPGLETYNTTTGECEFQQNAPCYPEECSNTSVPDICLRNEPVNDNNCGTYWVCKEGQVSPNCCPEGQGFSLTSYSCESDRLNPCYETCPAGYDQAPLSEEQIWLNSNCSEKCFAMSCQLAYGNDCMTYLTCEWRRNGFHGTKNVCPHGTFWAGDVATRNLSCVPPPDAMCPDDPCQDPANSGMTYSHFESCKKYWKCEGNTSVPKCCPGYESYNMTTGECEFQSNSTCQPEECDGILEPDICLRSYPVNDNFCGTYWACEAGQPFPTCCPEGYQFNIESSECEMYIMNPCLDACPIGYNETQISQEQMWLNRNCSDKCYANFCQFPLGEDCMTYMTCQWTRTGFHGTKKICAHGTFFARGQASRNISCITPAEAQCPYDPCLLPANRGITYSHFDSCKKYWRCEGRSSEPKCCPGLERYSMATGECEFQPSMPCSPEECYDTSVPDICGQNEPVNDNNCRTFWACKNGQPSAFCCAAGERFSLLSRSCNNDPKIPCRVPCPEGYLTVPLSEEQIWLNGNCSEKCRFDMCEIPYEGDCRKYIRCEWTPDGYYGIERTCVHGTFWALNRCTSPKAARCPFDFCLQRTNDGLTYPHEDSCKQYWQCEGRISVAKCCPGLERYNALTGACEYKPDMPCDPIECMPCWPKVCEYPVWTGSCNRTEPINDKHCASYWACEVDKFAPFCCPRGLFYNAILRTCEYDPFAPCIESCPTGYTIRMIEEQTTSTQGPIETTTPLITTTTGSLETTTTPMITPEEQEWLNGNCSLRCDVELCYIAHPSDCRMFIMCELTRRFQRRYHGTIQICAHGTFWAGANRVLAQTETTCDFSANVQCPNDPCSILSNAGLTYPHFSSCKQYWRCEAGISRPKCCPGYERYNRLTDKCEFKVDEQCFPEECPNVPDICQQLGQKSEPMNNNHCGTYWACHRGRPLPACCPDGLTYNMTSRSCEEDPMNPCLMPCPPDYKVEQNKGKRKVQGVPQSQTTALPRHQEEEETDKSKQTQIDQTYENTKISSLFPKRGNRNNKRTEKHKIKMAQGICLTGIKQYNLDDGFCRTYMKCVYEPGNDLPIGQRACCKPNQVFHGFINECGPRLGLMKECDPSCPRGFTEDCPLYEIPGDSTSYITVVNNVNFTIPCAVGTLYNHSKCGCGDVAEGSVDNSCPVELDILFNYPQYINQGSEDMVNIQQFGKAEEGAKINGQSTYYFNGNLRFAIDFFRQSLPKLFLQVDFLPLTSAKKGYRILVSNCQQAGASPEFIKPSLEVSLRNDTIQFRADTPNDETLISVPFTNGVLNRFKAYYDGQKVIITNDDGKSPKRVAQKRAKMTGDINVAEEGLEIGDCRIGEHQRGFIGDIAQVAVAKCLSKEHIEQMNNLDMMQKGGI